MNLLYRCPDCGAEVEVDGYGKTAPYCECGGWMKRVRMLRCPGTGLPRVNDACRACWQPVEGDNEDRAVEHWREVRRL